MPTIYLPVNDIIFDGIDDKSTTTAKIIFVSDDEKKTAFDINAQDTNIDIRIETARIFLKSFNNLLRRRIDLLGMNGNPAGVRGINFIKIDKNGRSEIFQIDADMTVPSGCAITQTKFTIASKDPNWSASINNYYDFLDFIDAIVKHYE